MIGKVELIGLEFFAKHGCYTEERTIGNKYTVDVSLTLEMGEAVKSDKLDGTVNYEDVYKIVSRIMARESHLLEYLAGQMAEEIKVTFLNVQQAKVSVAKHNPPINGLCELARVTIEV